ncbi:beta strand repeat-containing protein [Aquaspirillum soli]
MISEAQQTQLVQMTVGLFNAAPGVTYMNDFAKSLNAGSDVASLAKGLVNSPAFTALYPLFDTNTQFANKYMSNLLGNTVSVANKEWAANWMAGQLNAGVSRADAVLTTLVTLLGISSSDPNWGLAVQQFNNRVDVAKYYTLTKNGNATDLASLQGTISSVGSDAASVTQAKTQIDNNGVVITPPPPVTSPVFALTTAASDSPSLTTGNDTVTAGVDALNSGDLIIDQQTTDADVLTAVIGSGNDDQAPTIRKIEMVNLDFQGFGLTFDAINTQDSTFNLSTSQAGNSAATVTGINNKNVNFAPAASIKTLTLGGTAVTTDATTVKLAGNPLALDIGGDDAPIDLVTLNSTTAANTVTLSDTKGDFDLTTSKLILTGDKDITVKSTDTILNTVTVTNSLTSGAKATLELTAVAGTKDLSYADSTVGLKITGTAGGGLTVAKGATVELAVADALGTHSLNTAVKSVATDGTLNVSITKADQSTVKTGANVLTLNLSADVADSKIDTKLDTSAVKSTVNVLGTNALTIADWAAKDKSVFNATGTSANVTITQASGVTTDGVVILGGAGVLTATGTAKADTIVGGDNADVIGTGNGGTAAADQLTGGAGADTFVIAKGDSTATTSVTITDFVKGTDKLVLTGTLSTADNVDLTAVAATITNGVYAFGAGTDFQVKLENAGTALSATNMADSVQLGSATAAFAASGTSLKAGNYADNVDMTGAAGTTTITMGLGADKIKVDGDKSDKIVIAAGDSTVSAYDSITGFDCAGSSSGDNSAADNDVLDLVSTVIKADGIYTNKFAGADVSSSQGILTVQGLTVTNFNAFLTYLGTEVADGDTVGFAYGGNTYVFQGNATADIFIELIGVTGVTALAGAAAANTIVIA